MKPSTIAELMGSLGCTEWPARWAEIYDKVMAEYDKYGCELADPAFYDRLGDRYNVLHKYRDYYKTAAAEIAKDENLCRLLMLLSEVARDRAHAVEEFGKFTPPVAADGKREIKYDMLTALVMCATYDYTYGVLTSQNLPKEHIDYAMNVYDGMISTFMARNGGAPGAMSWVWYQDTAVKGHLFRMGRLEIEVNIKFPDSAIVFRNTIDKEKTVVLATSGKFHRDGYPLGSKNFEDETGAFDAFIEETDKSWCGYPYDERGYLAKDRVTLKKSEWTIALAGGDNVVGLHIPPGGGMTDELVTEAFDMAKEFLATFYPSFDYKAFVGVSWIMNPALATILGDNSNITKFMKRFTPMGIKSQGHGILNFIFLSPDPANAVIEDLPEDTSFQRKLKKVYLDGDCIYEMYGFILKEKI